MNAQPPAMPICLMICPDAVVVVGIGGGWFWSPHLTVAGSPPFAAIMPLPPADFALWPLVEYQYMAESGPEYLGNFFREALTPREYR